MGQEKIRVLELKKVEAEDRVIEVPAKIEIYGKIYEADTNYAPPSEFKDVNLKDILDVKIGEIPNHMEIHVEEAISIGELAGFLIFDQDGITVKLMEEERYYSGFIGLDYYLEVIEKVAKKLGFEALPLTETLYGFCGVELCKTFPKDVTIDEALREVERLDAKVREIEGKVKEAIERMLETS